MQKISSVKINNIISSLPCSKSYANRAIIYSYLKGYRNNLEMKNPSLDVAQLQTALNEIHSKKVYLGEGGTTIRFLLPLFAMKNTWTDLRVHPDFKKRPMEEFFVALKYLGANLFFSDEEDHLCTIKGPLTENLSLKIDCSKTTQFASALMMIAPFIKLDLKLENLNHSKKYINMTKSVMKSLDDEENFIVPVDFSSASYFIALALNNQTTFFPQIKIRDPLQADDVFLDIINEIGGKYELSEKGLIVFKKDSLKSLKVNVRNCIDLSMTLVYLAIFTEGDHEISGIDHLKFKESNRIQGIEDILKAIGVEFEIKESKFYIKGDTYTVVNSLNPLRDHRLVMLASLILKQVGGGTVSWENAVEKSFPNFFKILN